MDSEPRPQHPSRAGTPFCATNAREQPSNRTGTTDAADDTFEDAPGAIDQDTVDRLKAHLQNYNCVICMLVLCIFGVGVFAAWNADKQTKMAHLSMQLHGIQEQLASIRSMQYGQHELQQQLANQLADVHANSEKANALGQIASASCGTLWRSLNASRPHGPP